VLNDTDQNWWQGEINGSVGYFPREYCQPYDATAASEQEAKPAEKASTLTGKVVYEYEGNQRLIM
jgi:hypothetical protein